MDSTLISLSNIASHTLLFTVYLALFLPSGKSFTDYSTLVYKNCASETFTDAAYKMYSHALSSLFDELLAHSSQSKFFKAVAGDSQTGISGLFQCRGDISDEECYNCVNALSQMSNSLCSQAMAVQVQFVGCYTRYKADGFHESGTTSGTNDLLYKSCGESKEEAGGFLEQRDAAFASLESGVLSNNGYYTTSFDSFEVMAQCEGDLGACDCGKCVSSAVQIAQEECRNADSGEIYLDKCFMSYAYHPDGIAGKTNPGKLDRSRGFHHSSSLF